MRLCSALLLAFILLGCGKKSISYQEQIQPILNNRCVKCHGGESQYGKVVLTSYEALMNSRSASGKDVLVIPGSPNESRLYNLSGTNQAHFRMPPDTSDVTPLPKEELELLHKWILQGAKNN